MGAADTFISYSSNGSVVDGHTYESLVIRAM